MNKLIVITVCVIFVLSSYVNAVSNDYTYLSEEELYKQRQETLEKQLREKERVTTDVTGSREFITRDNEFLREDFTIIVDNYEPNVLVASVLEDQQAYVYANLIGIPVNPTIDIFPKIMSVRVVDRGRSSYVGGVRYIRPLSGEASLSNLGFLEIRLKQIPEEHRVPDTIDLNLSIEIRYNAEIQVLGGGGTFDIREVTSKEFNENSEEFKILGKGYMYASDIDVENERVSLKIYDYNLKNPRSVSLRGIGDVSGNLRWGYDMGSFDETNSFRVRLDEINKGFEELRARISVDGIIDSYELGDNIGDKKGDKIGDMEVYKISDNYISITNCNGERETLKIDDSAIDCNDKILKLIGISSGNSVVITILAGSGRGISTSELIIHIPVEKRAIELTPEKILSQIAKTKARVEKLNQSISKLEGVLKGWTNVCLGTVGYITAKSFLTGGIRFGDGKVKKDVGPAVSKEDVSEYFEDDKNLYCGDEKVIYVDGRENNKDIPKEAGYYSYVEGKGYVRCDTILLVVNKDTKDERKYFVNADYSLTPGDGEFIGETSISVSKDGKMISGPLKLGFLSKFRSYVGFGDQKESWNSIYKNSVDNAGEGIFYVYDEDNKIVRIYSVGVNGRIDNGDIDDRHISTISSSNRILYDVFVNNVINPIKRAALRGSSRVKVGDDPYKIERNRAFSADQVDCEDVMSSGDCTALFNACDPVMCPSSRFNFKGHYQVDDVVQSGLVGSLFLGLPNFPRPVVPVCLTGVWAGLKNIQSYLLGYQNCLSASIADDRSIGICDEIRSVFMCEILWKEITTLFKVKGGLIGMLFDKLGLGKSEGGGEYLGGVKESLESSKQVVNYFVNDYASNAFIAFRGRSSDEVGTEFCKRAVYGKGPAFSKLFSEISALRNPPQFTAYFEEHEYAPSLRMSRYQVFYHIYAGDGGSQSGEYKPLSQFRSYMKLRYSVYLKGEGLPVFYIVRPNSLGINDFVDESIDRIAPSGYQEICVNMNGREYCGFGKIVSSSFGVSQVANYIIQHDLSRNINSEQECRSDTSGYSPRAVIERRCSVDNPGRGLGIDSERNWVEVGSCGKEYGRCWLNIGQLDGSAQWEAYKEICKKNVGQMCSPGQKCIGGNIEDNVVTYSDGSKQNSFCCRGGVCKNSEILDDIDKAYTEKLYIYLTKDEKDVLIDAVENREINQFSDVNSRVRDLLRNHAVEFFYGMAMRALRIGDCGTVRAVLSCEDRNFKYAVDKGYISCDEFKENEYSKVYYNELKLLVDERCGEKEIEEKFAVKEVVLSNDFKFEKKYEEDNVYIAEYNVEQGRDYSLSEKIEFNKDIKSCEIKNGNNGFTVESKSNICLISGNIGIKGDIVKFEVKVLDETGVNEIVVKIVIKNNEEKVETNKILLCSNGEYICLIEKGERCSDTNKKFVKSFENKDLCEVYIQGRLAI